MAVIRAAQPEDAEAIARVHIATWASTYAGLMPAEVLERLSLPVQRERWAASLYQPQRVRTVVAVDGDDVVGFASFGPEPGNDYRYQGELYAIYIMQNHQRKGIGTRLLRAAAAGLLERSLPNLMLWVLSTNPARQWCEKLGATYLRERVVEFAGENLSEAAYGWSELKSLAGRP